MFDSPALAEVVVPLADEGARLDGFVHTHFPMFPSRASARKAVRRGQVLLDGIAVESSRYVAEGQRVTVVEAPSRAAKVFPAVVEVAYEDDQLAVVVKPPGLAVNGPRHRTLEHALPHNLAPGGGIDALSAPRPVHRLDAPTGGLVACAKTATALMELGRAFQERRVHKRYRAVLIGALHGEGEVDAPIDGRPARSRWRAVRHDRSLRGGWITTVDLWPETGRTHQLRRHVASLGHPILGDTLYGEPGLVLRGKGLFLWAVALKLPHPAGGQVTVEIEEPPKFASLREREARRWARWREET